MPVSEEAVSDLFQHLQSLGRSLKAFAGKDPDRLSISSLFLLSQVQTLGEVRCSGLAEVMGVDNSVVSRQLAVLEGAGLTGRRPDPQDGRAWLAHVTEAGERKLADLRSQRVTQVTTALADWTDGEAQQLCAQLVRLDEALQQAAHTGDPVTARGGPTAHRTGGTTGADIVGSKGKVHA